MIVSIQGLLRHRTACLAVVAVLSIVLVAASSAHAVVPVTGMSAWYDANDATTFTFGTGSAVAQWNDKSGNAEHVTQSFAGARPVRVFDPLFNRSVVRFDGSLDTLSKASTNVLNSTANTIFIVSTAKRGSNQELVSYGVSGNTSRFIFTDNTGVRLYSGGPTADISNNNYVTGNHIVFAGLLTAGVNASSNYIHDIEANTTFTTTGTFTGAANANRLDLGSYNAGGEFLNGDIAEILLYTTALSASDIQQNIDYLTEKWAVVPEPTTAGLLVVGAMVIGLRRRIAR
jgi:hypothetical protein